MEVNVGAHCSVDSCHQLDFLPFVCDLCDRPFCLDHRTYDAHKCPRAEDCDCRVILCPLCKNSVKIVPGEDVNVTFDRHRRSSDCKLKEKKKKCPVAGCKEKLTLSNIFDCPKCKQTVCLKHRYEDTHECAKENIPPKKATAAPKAMAAPALSGQEIRTPGKQPRRKKGGFFACLCGKKQLQNAD
eukprot:GEMP01074718.1.p1 GENE.GEMP01074718.1~~GEMP01074718.1.p1  ORF type:complete len:185 (+),score=39.26 GEMP01074718.1:77-631(+)